MVNADRGARDLVQHPRFKYTNTAIGYHFLIGLTGPRLGPEY